MEEEVRTAIEPDESLRCTGPEGPVQRAGYRARVQGGRGGTGAGSEAMGGGSRAAGTRPEHLGHRPQAGLDRKTVRSCLQQASWQPYRRADAGSLLTGTAVARRAGT